MLLVNATLTLCLVHQTKLDKVLAAVANINLALVRANICTQHQTVHHLVHRAVQVVAENTHNVHVRQVFLPELMDVRNIIRHHVILFVKKLIRITVVIVRL